MTIRVKLYTKSACPYCVNAKALFERLGVRYEEISVDGNPALRDEIRARYDWPTVPVVLVDGECVGGFSDVARLAESGELARRLGLG